MKVLVTGGGGFLGGAVVRALAARGDEAIACDTQFGAPAGAARQIAVDITDAAALAKAMQETRPDAVVHAAAMVGVLLSVRNPAQVVRVNIEGSLNVFEAMRAAGVRRCLHVSSEEVYGPFRSRMVDEDHPREPVHPYGICKAAVEQMGRSWHDVHGLDIIHLRTSWVYGPGLPRNRIPKTLIDAALDGRPLHLASGADTAIDHTYLDDFVDGTLAALDHAQHRFDAYNIASGTAVTVAQMIALVRGLVPGAQLSAGPGPYRYADDVEIVRKGALDVSRAAREFGWKPRYDMRRGLEASIAAARLARHPNH